jgi:hypothetical protein
MSDKFVDSPLTGFDPPSGGPKPPAGTVTNGEKAGAFSGYGRTPSPNAVPEVSYDKTSPSKPSGEKDQF